MQTPEPPLATTPVELFSTGSESLAPSIALRDAPLQDCGYDQVCGIDGTNEYFDMMACFRFFKIPFYTPDSSSLTDKYLRPVCDFLGKHIFEAQWRFTYEEDSSTVRLYAHDELQSRLVCLLYLKPTESICWGVSLSCPATMAMFDELANDFAAENPMAIVVTDEHRAFVVLSLRHRSLVIPSAWTDRFPSLVGNKSLRNIIGLLVFNLPGSKNLFFPTLPLLQGALNCAEPTLHTPRCFRDFDRYTLERSLPYLKAFLAWKTESTRQLRVDAERVGFGAHFRVDVKGFEANEGLWRSQFPNLGAPKRTRLQVLRNPRFGATDINDILDSSNVVEFELSSVRRQGPDLFSQVYFGHLRTSDGRMSPRLCLKLFVDVLFPLDAKELRSHFRNRPPHLRLAYLNFAEDMVRREEYAYHRLSEYQGMLVPRFYGCHLFTSPELPPAYGILLEAIDGPDLSQVDVECWSDEQQLCFTNHLRECVRAMHYAGVDQGDIHVGQFLLPGAAGLDDAEDYVYQEGDPIVLMDFAFTRPRLGDEQVPGVISQALFNGMAILREELREFGFRSENFGPSWRTLDLYEH